jgi:hypothetical protein
VDEVAHASKSANRTEETLCKLAAETVARHGETDEADDDLFGPGQPKPSARPRRNKATALGQCATSPIPTPG